MYFKIPMWALTPCLSYNAYASMVVKNLLCTVIACMIECSFYLQPLQEDMVIIQNFHDSLVIGAACAAVSQITIKSVSTYKSVLVTITNGTRQVHNYVDYTHMEIARL